MRTFSGVTLAVIIFIQVACSPASSTGTSPISGTNTAKASANVTQPAVSQCDYLGKPTPSASETSIFPPVSAQDHVRGPAEVYLTIIEYSDFQCPACTQYAALLNQIQKKHPQDIRIVFRPFPLRTVNDKASLSVQVAEAANRQGKFWEMHDLLFTRQGEWTKLSAADFQSWAATQAASIGLDQTIFEHDLTSPAIIALAQKAWDEGIRLQLPGAPLILLNGEIMRWQPGLLENLETLINLALLPKYQFNSCPPIVIQASKHYLATLKTAKGNIVIELLADKAYNTVNNFVFLAQNGWYDNTTFQRVVPGFVAQAGDPSGTGAGNPGYFIPDEIDSALRFDRAGLVGMANNGPGTNGGQFFITLAPAASLNGKYTLFGQVLSGLDVLTRLTPRDPQPGQNLPDGDLLLTISIEEK